MKYVIKWKKDSELICIHEVYEDKKYDAVQLSRCRNNNSCLFGDIPRENSKRNRPNSRKVSKANHGLVTPKAYRL
jgi:hypothetical protein